MSSPPQSPKVSRNKRVSVSHHSSGLRSGGFHFVPFTEEASLSTRGQALPQIIQSRSHHNLPDLTKVRRASQYPDSEDEHDVEAGLVIKRRGSRWDRSRSRDNALLRTNSRAEAPIPLPPSDFPLTRGTDSFYDARRRDSLAAASTLMTQEMRSQRLIGNSNPRYQWALYYKSPKDLKGMSKGLRQYYERNNYLIQQYIYIDKLLDSSLPLRLIEEYNETDEVNIPPTISEESAATARASPPEENGLSGTAHKSGSSGQLAPVSKIKRTPKDIYRVPDDEETPLLNRGEDGEVDGVETDSDGPPAFVPEEDVDSEDRIVTVAIYVNMAANTALLAMKIVVTILTSSLSVLASLVDAALDFLSTAIVFITTNLITSGQTDIYNYPVGRRRLEPIGVLVFSVIMITSFFQVFLQAAERLTSSDREVVHLTNSAIGIMAATVVIKFLCWLYCRLIKNSSVQALAQDAMTDVVFNIFSIIFPLLGYFFDLWFMDPLGGMLLSLYVIVTWSRTTSMHIANLTGRAASKDERNILLYLTMRFAHTIRYIQALSAYHVGDKLNVEVDIVLDEEMNLRDSHDLGESLQYVLESVPGVERAFVHSDYRSVNLPSHMKQ